MFATTRRLGSFLCLILLCGTGIAQETQPAAPPKSDAIIGEALGRIRAERIEADIKTLVGFGTRHTLSVKVEGKRGATAASDWIKKELEAAAAASKGRMKVRFDAFDPRAFARGDRAALAKLGVTEVRNVLATLEGSEPGRVLIVSGHYDSHAPAVGTTSNRMRREPMTTAAARRQ